MWVVKTNHEHDTKAIRDFNFILLTNLRRKFY